MGKIKLHLSYNVKCNLHVIHIEGNKELHFALPSFKTCKEVWSAVSSSMTEICACSSFVQRWEVQELRHMRLFSEFVQTLKLDMDLCFLLPGQRWAQQHVRFPHGRLKDHCAYLHSPLPLHSTAVGMAQKTSRECGDGLEEMRRRMHVQMSEIRKDVDKIQPTIKSQMAVLTVGSSLS